MNASEWIDGALQRAARVIEEAVRERVFPGAVVGLAAAGGESRSLASGSLTYELSAAPAAADTIYDAASLTKVLPTSTLALIGLAQGLYALDSPVQRFLPEMRHGKAERILVKHLLTHTLDFGMRLSSLRDLQPEALLGMVCAAEPVCEPGGRFFYSNATSILLGLLVERAMGAGLAELAARRLFVPLGITDAWFGRAPEACLQRVAPTEDDPWRGRQIRGETHDETAWRLRDIMTPGSAGLFVTMPGLLRFLEMVLEGGAAGGSRILRQSTLRQAATNQIGYLGASTGLGWELNQPYMGDGAAARIGKTGFTGCSIVVDTASKAAVALLSNWTWPIRRESRDAIDRVRRSLSNAVFAQALTAA